MNQINHYDGAIAQSHRDAMRTSEFTAQDILDAFSAFAQDFEEFDPDNPEHSNTSEHSADSASLCSNESDSSSEGSVSSLDEMALIYADLEDMETEFEESILQESISQIDESGPAIDEEDSIIGRAVSTTDQTIDETASLSEEPASAPSPEAPSLFLAEQSRYCEFPLSFVVYRGQNGSIIGIETQNHGQRYQYHIPIRPKQVLDSNGLDLFIKILKHEQVCTNAFSKFFTTIGEAYCSIRNIPWLPERAYEGASEIVHQDTLKCIAKYLGKKGVLELNMRDKWSPDIREILEDFYRVGNVMTAPEARLFIHMNNIVVLPYVLKMVSPRDILLFFFQKQIKLFASRCLKESNFKDLMTTGF